MRKITHSAQDIREQIPSDHSGLMHIISQKYGTIILDQDDGDGILRLWDDLVSLDLCPFIESDGSQVIVGITKNGENCKEDIVIQASNLVIGLTQVAALYAAPLPVIPFLPKPLEEGFE